MVMNAVPTHQLGSSAPNVPGYDLLRPIGHGAFGCVWLARNRATDDYRAVKVVGRHTVGSGDAAEDELKGVKRFWRISDEAKEGLVRVMEVGRTEESEDLFYVMRLADAETTSGSGPARLEAPSGEVQTRRAGEELVERYRPRTLGSELRRREKLPLDEVIEVGIALARGLALMHESHRPACHCDIKPSNILYVDGKPVLGDPGLVRKTGARPETFTRGYTEPESQGTPPGDCYALGMTLWRAFSGLEPEFFPNLPKDSTSDVRWGRFMRVLNKACGWDRTERYQDALELLRDIERLRKRKRPASLLALAVGAISALLIGGWWLSIRLPAGGEPERVLFADSFGEATLDTNVWQLTAQTLRSHPGAGRAQGQPSLDNGLLSLRCTAEHEQGWHIQQSLCLDSRINLKGPGDTVVTVSLAVEGVGVMAIDLTDGLQPAVARDARGTARLWTVVNNPALQVPKREAQVGIELFADSNMAKVRWTSEGKLHVRFVDISPLAAWRLRFYAETVSAAGMPGFTCTLWLDDVQVKVVSKMPLIGGWVSDQPTGEKVPGVRIRNAVAGSITTTDDEGAYLLVAKAGRNRLEFPDPRYVAVNATELELSALSATRRDLTVRKVRPEPGDVLETRTLADAEGLFVFSTTHLYWMGERWALRREPLGGGATELLAFLPETAGIACCCNRLFKVGSYETPALFEITPEGTTNLLFWLTNLTVFSPDHTVYPRSLACDGTNFWFIEWNRAHTNRCGVFAVDMNTGQQRAHFVSVDYGLQGIACGNGRLYLSAGRRVIYEIDPARAAEKGLLELGIVREFQGQYGCLSFHSNQLWGAGTGGKIHRILLPK